MRRREDETGARLKKEERKKDGDKTREKESPRRNKNKRNGGAWRRCEVRRGERRKEATEDQRRHPGLAGGD